MSDEDTRTIRVTESAWKYINALKDPGDTFADATDKLVDEHDALKYDTLPPHYESDDAEHRLAGAKPTTQPTNDE